jgi:hypothetical protein
MSAGVGVQIGVQNPIFGSTTLWEVNDYPSGASAIVSALVSHSSFISQNGKGDGHESRVGNET